MKQFFFIPVKYLAVAVMATFFHLAAAQDDPFGRYNRVEDESELKAGETMEGKVKDNFFLKTEVNKTECFVGETITAVFKAYSRLNSNSQVVKRPSLTGFSVLEMVDGYNNQPAIEKVKGKFYYVHLIRKVQLFPLQAGTYVLEGAEVESEIFFRRGGERDRGLSSLRNLLRRTDRHDNARDEQLQYHVTLETPPVNVEVKSLPESGQPNDFSGAVGNFSVSLQMRDKNLRQYDPAKVKVAVKGSGNFPLITAPHVNWPDGIDVSEPVVDEEVNRYVFPLSGVKVFEYTIETKDTGDFVIPPLRFSYFDPQAKAYKTAEASPVNYTVAPGRNKNADNFQDNYASGDSTGFPLQWYWFGGIALIIVGWLVYQAFSIRRMKKTGVLPSPVITETDTGIMDISEQHLSRAESTLEDADTKAFYNAIKQTIKETIAFKYQVPSVALNWNVMQQLLRQHEVQEPVIEKTLALLNNCEWALYTPGQRVEDKYETLASLRELLPELRGKAR